MEEILAPHGAGVPQLRTPKLGPEIPRTTHKTAHSGPEVLGKEKQKIHHEVQRLKIYTQISEFITL